MKNVSRYYTVKKERDDEFDEHIERRLKEGYKLYGNPYISKGGFYCQAMIK